MKLDKIKFARLVQFITELRPQRHLDLEKLDAHCDVEIPVVCPPTEVADIAKLMELMAEGTRKIEAVKLHRKLTGWGLKESKDEVEKHWKAPVVDKKAAMLAKIDQQLNGVAQPPFAEYTLKSFNEAELKIIKDFINSY